MDNATEKTELPKYLKEVIREKFIFGVTSELISITDGTAIHESC